MKHTNIDNRTEINRLKAENARLKAEVERLTKAGDPMAKEIYDEAQLFAWDVDEVMPECVQAWNDAKEGKPSA